MKNNKMPSKDQVKFASMRAKIDHEYTMKNDLQKNGTLIHERGRFDKNGKLLFKRSVIVSKADVLTLKKAVKVKDKKARRAMMLNVAWKYVTPDKLATDTDSYNLGLNTKARCRCIAELFLQGIGADRKDY